MESRACRADNKAEYYDNKHEYRNLNYYIDEEEEEQASPSHVEPVYQSILKKPKSSCNCGCHHETNNHNVSAFTSYSRDEPEPEPRRSKHHHQPAAKSSSFDESERRYERDENYNSASMYGYETEHPRSRSAMRENVASSDSTQKMSYAKFVLASRKPFFWYSTKPGAEVIYDMEQVLDSPMSVDYGTNYMVSQNLSPPRPVYYNRPNHSLPSNNLQASYAGPTNYASAVSTPGRWVSPKNSQPINTDYIGDRFNQLDTGLVTRPTIQRQRSPMLEYDEEFNASAGQLTRRPANCNTCPRAYYQDKNQCQSRHSDCLVKRIINDMKFSFRKKNTH